MKSATPITACGKYCFCNRDTHSKAPHQFYQEQTASASVLPTIDMLSRSMMYRQVSVTAPMRLPLKGVESKPRLLICPGLRAAKGAADQTTDRFANKVVLTRTSNFYDGA
jgi:hypothetical protein